MRTEKRIGRPEHGASAARRNDPLFLGGILPSIGCVLVAAFAFLALFAGPAAAGKDPFADIDNDHWAYSAVSQLAAKGVIDGYADGRFKGDKPITRYEMAMVLARLLEGLPINEGRLNTADFKTVEKLTMEFAEELSLLGVKVDAIEAELKSLKTEIKEVKEEIRQVEQIKNSTRDRVNVNGEVWMILGNLKKAVDTLDDDWVNEAGLYLSYFMEIDDRIAAFIKIKNEEIDLSNIGGSSDGTIDELYIDIDGFYELFNMRMGRQRVTLGHSLVLDDKVDGVTFTKVLDRLEMKFFAFSTRESKPGVNNQLYGDSSGSKPFWWYDDTYQVSGDGNAATKGTRANYIANGGYAIGDAVTLYSSPFMFPQPWDIVTGDPNATIANHRSNNHAGIAVTDRSRLLMPMDSLPAGTMQPVSIATGAFPKTNGLDVDGREIQDSASQAGGLYLNAAYRDWENKTRNGLDSIGVNFNADFGGHNLAAYYLMRRYEAYDPYTVLGDPYAAMVDYDGDGAIDFRNGKAVSPRANPSYWGITLDGEVVKNLGYFFEYVHFDPDIANVGVDPVTGMAKTGGAWKGNNLSQGTAWIAGLDWNINEDVNLILQYGAGDEEFVAASIYRDYRFHGMEGRLTPTDRATALPGDYDEGTLSLTGVRDLLVKLSADFTDVTRGIFSFEGVRDFDSTRDRLVAGDPAVTGHQNLDYNLICARFEHIYKTHTTIALEYRNLWFTEDRVNDNRVEGVVGDYTDDLNNGGWSRIMTEVRVVF